MKGHAYDTANGPVVDVAAGVWRSSVHRILRALLFSAALVFAYYVAPFSGGHPGGQLVLLVTGMAAAVALLTVGVRSVIRSATPRARAIEVLVLFLPVFLLSFASAYYAMSLDSTGDFSQSLSRTDALYFALTTFSSVGYGDIVPVSQAARIVVMVQMLADVALIGAGARVLLSAVDVGLRRRDEPGEPDDPDEPPDVSHARGPHD